MANPKALARRAEGGGWWMMRGLPACLSAGHCACRSSGWLPPRDWHGPNVTPPPVAVGLTSQEIIIKWPQFEALATSALQPLPLPPLEWTDGLSPPFPPGLLASPKHNRLLPQPTIAPLPSTLSNRRTDQAVQKSKLFRQDLCWCWSLVVVLYISKNRRFFLRLYFWRASLR